MGCKYHSSIAIVIIMLIILDSFGSVCIINHEGDTPSSTSFQIINSQKLRKGCTMLVNETAVFTLELPNQSYYINKPRAK